MWSFRKFFVILHIGKDLSLKEKINKRENTKRTNT